MRIIIKNQQKKIPISDRAIKRLASKIFRILSSATDATLRIKAHRASTDSSGELTVVYVDNKVIQQLNYRFLARRYPTDVLCFDLSKKEKFLADIVISTEKACENACLFKTSPHRELKLYLIHGILHLFGFKDYRKKDRIRMQRKACQILKRI